MKKGQIGIELGTKHIRVCTREKEQYVRIKNMIAIDGEANIRAVGNEAFRMYEKEPSNIQMIAPITSGVIGDYTNMRLLLAAVLRKYFRYFRKCTVDVAAPSDITGVEKRAFYDLVWESGRRLRDVRLVSKPMLAAIGSGLDVNAPCGNMIIDFGAGTTEISVISLGGIVKSRLLKFGGDQIDQWIVHKVRRLYNIDIGRRSAERLKLQYSKNEDEKQVVMKGRDLLSGLPGKITVPVSNHGAGLIGRRKSEKLYERSRDGGKSRSGNRSAGAGGRYYGSGNFYIRRQRVISQSGDVAGRRVGDFCLYGTAAGGYGNSRTEFLS